ncbi:MAG: ImmA/IrrE family metallo-endopeptidase [Candidatus Aminicenantes bacterium]|nr:ImmA/IrrE family metallo-endopeptidase [Candidatus Aminicenantes bacterium]
MPRKREIFIEPPRLTSEFIRQEAEKFRQKYVTPPDALPVPIIQIVELRLKLEIVPIIGLMEIDIDGFLTSDLKKICIDADIYQNPRKENRLRFTLAHEVGHWVLHKDEVKRCAFRNPEDWMHFREDFLEENLNWFEQHAYEFAGRLLVPKESLLFELKSLDDKIKKYRSIAAGELESLEDALSRILCAKFGVSPEVIARRIRREKINLARL